VNCPVREAFLSTFGLKGLPMLVFQRVRRYVAGRAAALQLSMNADKSALPRQPDRLEIFDTVLR
jgi:hypothetical protein